MSSGAQKHISVPSSDSPQIYEWAGHYWYVLRASALQASETISDENAALLVQAFETYAVTLPCPECRAHYASDWAVHPYTATHARSALASMKWVEDLRLRIEGRKKAEQKSPAVPFARAYANPARASAILSQGRVGTPGTITPQASTIQTIQAKRAAVELMKPMSAGGSAMKRQVAIQSALQQTAANKAGPRGCNCGTKKKA